jgi:hypothetical protein
MLACLLSAVACLPAQVKVERDTRQSLFVGLSLADAPYMPCYLSTHFMLTCVCVSVCLSACLPSQSKLERDTGQSLFVGLSLADSIATCLRLGHNKAAANLRRYNL